MRRSSVVVALAALCAACGSPSGGGSPTPSARASASASAAAGPCASVIVTTPIASVPAACAALWAPYGVTKVPPANLLDGTPAPPTVVDETGGAVPQATADAWALALNHAGMWSQWSEANLQYGLTLHYEGAAVVNTQIDQLLRAGTAVIDPACDEFGTKYTLKPVDASLVQFLARYGERTSGAYAFVASYPGPCEIDKVNPDGSRQAIVAATDPVTSLIGGQLVDDPVLASLWISDAGGVCTTKGAPANWCAA